MRIRLIQPFDSHITISLSQLYVVQNISFIAFTAFYEQALL